jgi:hypothetical protein
MWWGGFLTLVCGELMNFSAYALAPPMLITPLGSLNVVVNAVCGESSFCTVTFYANHAHNLTRSP